MQRSTQCGRHPDAVFQIAVTVVDDWSRAAEIEVSARLAHREVMVRSLLALIGLEDRLVYVRDLLDAPVSLARD